MTAKETHDEIQQTSVEASAETISTILNILNAMNDRIAKLEAMVTKSLIVFDDDAYHLRPIITEGEPTINVAKLRRRV